MLQPGDPIPHFEVAGLGGEKVAYRSIWQRRHLLLVSLPPVAPLDETAFQQALVPALNDLAGDDVACVLTRDVVHGAPRPGVLIADRWGEVRFVSDPARVPSVGELAEWLRFIRHQCPECEGESR